MKNYGQFENLGEMPYNIHSKSVNTLLYIRKSIGKNRYKENPVESTMVKIK